MKKHLELEITYEEKPMRITIQCLSDEVPLIYAVWPQDALLKEAFDNEFVLFTQYFKGSSRESKTLWHKVHYSKGVKFFNLGFENAVWEVLSNLVNPEIH